jgi:type II secretory pathway component PulF
MFVSPRIGLKPLGQLCRRLAVATAAGLEDRRIWRDEAERGGRAQRAAAGQVATALSRGEAVSDALVRTGSYYPALFQQIVAVGDRTGRLDRTYKRLAEHYENMLAARRTLLTAMAWPAIQIGIVALTIGVVIWISSALNLKTIDGEPQDLFGLGLTGNSGLAIYLILLTAAAIAALLFVQAWSRGLLWTRPLQRMAIKLPGVGSAIETLALARFTWALQLVLDTPMDLRKALPLALEATGHATYQDLGPQVAGSISRGATLHAALAETGKFPRDLLDALAVGEQSGMTAETMERLSRQYQERAIAAIRILAGAFAAIVWVLVAALIITLIVRVVSGYSGMIQDLSKPGGGI